MKQKKLLAYALLPVLSLVFIGANSALAFSGGEGFGGHKGFRGGDREGLVPSEIRQEWRSGYVNLSEEERQARREEMKVNRGVMREERKAQIEAFTGISHDELKTARQSGESMGDILTEQGITEDEAESFLAERANDRVDNIVEKRDLDAEDEQTLRDRIATFVQKILGKWFGADA